MKIIMLVSVVIPCFNVESTVGECIESVIRQTYRDIEIIAVENNSTDGTMKRLSELQEKHPSQITVLSATKQGASSARNEGLRFSKGDWIQFLDADDLLLPTKIEQQVKLINEEKETPALVVGNYRYVPNKNRVKDIFWERKSIWLSVVKGTLGITSSNLWNRKEIERAGGWNEGQKSSQEYELMFRLLKNKEIAVFDENLNTIVRRREDSISSSDILGNRLRASELHHEMLLFVKKNRREEFNRFEQEFLEAALKNISQIGFSHPDRAKKLFNEIIPSTFRINDRKFSRVYQFFFNRFGFDVAQRIFKPYLSIKRSLIGNF